jgi:hypothetical protein
LASRGWIALLALCLGASLALPALAAADTQDIIEPQNEPPTAKDGWQAGTCTTDTPHCTPATPENFFKQASGHPPLGFTQYTIRHTTVLENVIEPLVERSKAVRSRRCESICRPG